MARLTSPPGPDRPAIPFTVRAYLQQGAVLDASRPVCLDALLASLARRHAAAGQPGSLLDGGLDADDPADWDVPLAACHAAGEWHWLASAGTATGPDGSPLQPGPPDAHRLSSRLDEHRAAAIAVHVPRDAGGTRGRFRGRTTPVLTVVAHAVEWRGVGDPDAVRALLEPVGSIGARRGSGEGAVRAWQVTADPTADPDAHGHLRADGTLSRAVPVACAERVNATGWTPGIAAIRPPSFHPARARTLAVPTSPQPISGPSTNRKDPDAPARPH